MAGRLKKRPVRQVVFCDLVVEKGCLHNLNRCEPQQCVESSCSVTSAKLVLSHDINKWVFASWYWVARSLLGMGWGIGVAVTVLCEPSFGAVQDLSFWCSENASWWFNVAIKAFVSQEVEDSKECFYCDLITNSTSA